MKFLYILVCICMSVSSLAQTPNQKPCSLPEASQFDFWIGDWIATWNDTLHGTNHIEKMFGNCTVQKTFLILT